MQNLRKGPKVENREPSANPGGHTKRELKAKLPDFTKDGKQGKKGKKMLVTTTPSVSMAPSESPSVSMAPSESPSVSMAPTESPSVSMVPSVSAAPSESPPTESPSESPTCKTRDEFCTSGDCCSGLDCQYGSSGKFECVS